jgi:hypothetical protein
LLPVRVTGEPELREGEQEEEKEKERKERTGNRELTGKGLDCNETCY